MLLTLESIASIIKNNSLPSPTEQANKFITYLGSHLSRPSDSYDVSIEQASIYGILGIKVGMAERKDFNFIITALEEQKLLNVRHQEGATSGGKKIPLAVSLTMAGWERYHELQRLVKNSRGATSFEPTGWQRVDRTILRATERLVSARNGEDYQGVGHLCREALISLGQVVWDRARHPILGWRKCKRNRYQASVRGLHRCGIVIERERTGAKTRPRFAGSREWLAT